MLNKIGNYLRSFFNDLFGGNPPRDPYAGGPVRNKRGPNDRNAAVAVAEPDDE